MKNLSIVTIILLIIVTYFSNAALLQRRHRCPIHDRALSLYGVDGISSVEGDIIVYAVAEGEVGLGVLHRGGSKLSRLMRRGTSDDGSITLHENEDVPEILVKEVRILNVLSDVYWTQRIVEDRISNPHGEHAEDVWILKLDQLQAVICNHMEFSEFLHLLDNKSI
jgi:hypothetical protein